MLLIPCPNCGERDEREFSYGGRAIKYPELNSSAGIQNWHEVLHLRDNSTTRVAEYWYHQSGCECWFEIARDTRSHQIEGES